jgi:hypothetical protein
MQNSLSFAYENAVDKNLLRTFSKLLFFEEFLKNKKISILKNSFTSFLLFSQTKEISFGGPSTFLNFVFYFAPVFKIATFSKNFFKK